MLYLNISDVPLPSQLSFVYICTHWIYNLIYFIRYSHYYLNFTLTLILRFPLQKYRTVFACLQMKCLQYWPQELGVVLTYCNLRISLKSSQAWADFALSHIEICKVCFYFNVIMIILAASVNNNYHRAIIVYNSILIVI